MWSRKRKSNVVSAGELDIRHLKDYISWEIERRHIKSSLLLRKTMEMRKSEKNRHVFLIIESPCSSQDLASARPWTAYLTNQFRAPWLRLIHLAAFFFIRVKISWVSIHRTSNATIITFEEIFPARPHRLAIPIVKYFRVRFIMKSRTS